MIEKRFDVPYIAAQALREKQVQQNYRPVIAIHKWFARRPGTLFRGLMLAEFGENTLRESFTQSNKFDGIKVCDPFMGGGTPLIEANRLGADVLGLDINPMAYWIVRQALKHLDLESYAEEGKRLISMLAKEIGDYYTTRCCCGEQASVKYFLWVKQNDCACCGNTFDVWPGYLLAKDTRHRANVLICRNCGELNEILHLETLGRCHSCSTPLQIEGNARRGQAACPECNTTSSLPNRDSPPAHRLYAVEYYCHSCRPRHKGRFFKKADADDLQKCFEAHQRFEKIEQRFVPKEPIPHGDETKRLLRWGYRHYRDLFNSRQLLGLELACRHISGVADERIRNALATNLSDLLRYQNLLCRYDTMALKSLDIFSIHGYPVSLVQCESNMLGISNGSGNVGSGGWTNIIDKFAKAKAYCDHPFETILGGNRKTTVFTPDEWIGDHRKGASRRIVELRTEDACDVRLEPNSLDAVLTDPPYFGMVQYAELMDFCYVWLRGLVGEQETAFKPTSTRHRNELTGNNTNARGLEHFTEGLSRVFQLMAAALKRGRPLAFTFHHNDISAYAAIGVAILDSGMRCTATLPCPAEMGGSIHISKTKSSILDSVFVCRHVATNPITPTDHKALLTEALISDLDNLAKAGYTPTDGDMNCLLNGHACRLAINASAETWNSQPPIQQKLLAFTETLEAMAAPLHTLGRALERRAARREPELPLFAGVGAAG